MRLKLRLLPEMVAFELMQGTMSPGKINQDQVAPDFKPGLYHYEIRSSDTDFRDHLQIASLFAMMQESAYHHAEQIGIGTMLFDTLDLTWLLTKISVRLDRLPHWGESVWIRTWSRGTRKLLFERDFEFMSGSPDSTPFGRASSEWLVARRDNHRPQRPEPVLEAAGLALTKTETFAALDFSCPKIVSRLDSEAVASGMRIPDLIKFADFSDIDRNRHVNNTRYIAWSMDAAYFSFLGGLRQLDDPATQALDLSAIDINYLSEILPGECSHLFIDRDPADASQMTVEGRKADQSTTSFRARLQFRSL